MRTTYLPFLGLVLAGTLVSAPVLGADIQAAVEGLNSAKGHVICGIFQSADGFPKDTQKTVKLVTVPASQAGVRCTFTDVAAGTYAISVFHDENDDGVLNTNFLGMPREGYGVSNNHTYAAHAPGFEESRFTVDAAGSIELRIRMKY